MIELIEKPLNDAVTGRIKLTRHDVVRKSKFGPGEKGQHSHATGTERVCARSYRHWEINVEKTVRFR